MISLYELILIVYFWVSTLRLVLYINTEKKTIWKKGNDPVIKQEIFINGLYENLPLQCRLHQPKTLQKALTLGSIKHLLCKEK